MSTDLVPVNPPGVDVQLTRADAWRGLIWKAEVPMPFVAPIVDCVVLERFDDGFLREIAHLTPDGGTEAIQERVLLDSAAGTVTFLRLTGSAVGRILNRVVESSSGELFLQFQFILGLAGIEHGSPAEDDYRTGFAAGYLSAVQTTLEALRQMARTGVDPTAHLRRDPPGPVTRPPASAAPAAQPH